MSEQDSAAPQGASDPQSIEDKLASFDFDAPSAPAGGQEERKEAGDDDAMVELAGEAKAEEPVSEDDPEINLRDNTKIKLSELKRGYRPDWENLDKRAVDFVRRQQAFQQATAGFSQVQQQTTALLQQAVEFVQSRMPKEPDASLADSDPFEYQKQKAYFDAEKAKLDNWRAQRDAYTQQAVQQQKQAQARRILQEREAMLRALPDLKDPVKLAKFTEDVKALGSELGFSPAEMAGVHDHRLMKLIAKAVRGIELEKAYEKAKAKLKEAQKPPVDVQTPQKRRSSPQVQSDKLNAGLDKLRKTGRPEDAEAVLSMFE